MLNRIKKAKGFLAGVVITGTFFLFIQAQKTDSYFEISKNLDIFTNLFKELNTYYVDPIEPGKMIKTGIDAMLEDLDPYTNYITESDIEEYEFQTTGKYGGIGANMRPKGNDVFVGDVYEFSPAQKAGLRPGDQVLSIENKKITADDYNEISTLLKGSPGSKVSIRVKDAFTGEESEKIITRGEIEVSSVPFSGLVGSNKKIAYVRLTQFTPGCARLVRHALDSLKKAQPDLKGVVLDLRDNPGGLLNEAVDICNIFVERGQLVVSIKGKVPDMDENYRTGDAPWDLNIPVSVVVNGSSASASEIVAGTIQDLDRGVVIGKRSYGKGLVQRTLPLGYNANLKLTIAKYYTPSGRCIQAIDYSHRNADGSVGKVPDSLKKLFKTKSGRPVLSGGGVDPDVEVDEPNISKLAIILYTKNFFFDYATQYVKENRSIPPAATFAFGNDDFEKFTKWLESKDYSYKTETEIMLDSLKSVAQQEKYFDAVKTEFNSLQAKLSHDKKQDLIKHKAELTRFLENEIVSRYYYQRGRIENSLKDDNELAKAVDLIDQPVQYQALLKPKK